MATPLKVLESALGEPFAAPDGGHGRIELLEPATPAEIEDLERELPGRLPQEIRALLARCRGLELLGHQVLFCESSWGQHLEGTGRWQVHVLPDVFGNSWYVDVQSDGAWGPVLFVCHDPPVLLYQSNDLAGFLSVLLDSYRPGGSSTLRAVYEDERGIWPGNPLARPVEEARASHDSTLREFAVTLPDGSLVADLRECTVGSGIVWGCFGPRTELRRHGDDLLLAMIHPAGVDQGKGLFSRLFGR